MTCIKCNGKMYLDRTFTDNENFEVYCISCGVRKFVNKKTRFGAWLAQQERLQTSNG